MRFAIAYYRVSTSRQGKSGLGLEAQQSAVRSYCAINDCSLLYEILEVRSTRKHRPKLQEAFELCKVHQATLIVARLDRLGRDVEEIAHNIKLPIEIIVIDSPQANRFTIHILAAVAEEERRKISINTKDALMVAKGKGKKLGKNGKILSKQNKEAADNFAIAISPVINEIWGKGYRTINAITLELNRRKIPTFRKGSRWHLASVHNLITRIKKINKQ